MKTIIVNEKNNARRAHLREPFAAAGRFPARAGAEMQARGEDPGMKLSADLCTTRVLNAYCTEVCCETARGRVCNTYCNDPA